MNPIYNRAAANHPLPQSLPALCRSHGEAAEPAVARARILAAMGLLKPSMALDGLNAGQLAALQPGRARCPGDDNGVRIWPRLPAVATVP